MYHLFEQRFKQIEGCYIHFQKCVCLEERRVCTVVPKKELPSSAPINLIIFILGRNMALMTNSSRNSSAEVASNDAQGSAPQRNGFSSHFDAYLQMQTPSHAYRLMLMHADPEVGQRMLPGGGGEAVLEAWHPKLHPYRELIHIRNLAVTPLEFKRWLDTSILRFNITRAFFVSSQAALDMAVQ